MKKIKLSTKRKLPPKSRTVLVDDDDFERLNKYSWFIHKGRSTMYASRNDYSTGKRTMIYMHREIMKTPNFLEADHKDGNGLNNQKSNLRNATKSQNKFNRGSQKNSMSKYKGVHMWSSKYKRLDGGISIYPIKWTAAITANGKRKYIGLYETQKEAALAYNLMATKLHGQFANLNKL